MNTNHDQTNPAPGNTREDEAVLQKLAIHQRRLKWLTGIAVSFWALAAIGTVIVLFCYIFFVAPKEKAIMSDYGLYGRLAERTGGAPPQVTEPPTRADRALGVNFTMSYVITRGVLAVAVSVLILSGGTLATLLLVIFNRRVTLQQISYSLAQISHQLEDLQARRPA